MIQRIQSLYLLLAGLTMTVGIFFIPLFERSEGPLFITEFGLYMMMSGVAAGLALSNIFNYKKRQTQVVLNRLNIILSFVLFGLLLWKNYELNNSALAGLLYGSFMPLVNVIFLVLANRGILKDEMLVRASERFR